MRLGWIFSIRRGHLAVNSGLSILKSPPARRAGFPRLQLCLEPGLKVRRIDKQGLYARILRTFECVGGLFVGYDKRELNVRQLAARRGVYECLEIRPPAGDQHGRPHHSSTPPSPSATSPQI